MKPDSRTEAEQAHLDHQLGELLQELRIAMPGVQLLFAFLLAVPFQQRFGGVSQFERDVYLFTLLAATCSSALLIAPAAYHRIRFGRGDKPQIIRFAERSAIAGLVCLACSMTGAVLLVTSALFGEATAAVVTVLVAGMFSWLWFGIAVATRRDPRPDGT